MKVSNFFATVLENHIHKHSEDFVSEFQGTTDEWSFLTHEMDPQELRYASLRRWAVDYLISVVKERMKKFASSSDQLAKCSVRVVNESRDSFQLELSFPPKPKE